MNRALQRVLPFMGWLKETSPATLRADFFAGLTVALVLIPQSMAYAQLAGLPSYYGLYAAFLPPTIASLFGSSRQLATGPVAVVSLMTATALEPLASAGSSQYVQYAILLALMAGLVQFLLGVLRLGMVVNFLSHPVVNGFTCAAALIIATSQLPKVLGVTVENAPHHYQTVYRVLQAASAHVHWPTLAMAVLALAIMIGLRFVSSRIPAMLVAVVVTTTLSWAIGFEKKETVPLSAIHSPEVHRLVAQYNSVLADRDRIAVLRTEAERDLMATGLETHLCARCHLQPLSIENLERGIRPEDIRTGAVVAIHHHAGLLDALRGVLREQESNARTMLRGYRFERVRDEEQDTWFYRPRQAGAGGQQASAGWRISVGNGKLLDVEGKEIQLNMVSGGAVVATIPSGLPRLAAPKIDFYVARKLISGAIIIAVLGFMEAISIAKAMAARTKQRIDPNQELIGQGLANMVGCCAQSYACSGSFSRSAVNLRAGAASGLSSVFSSGIVVVVLLFCTPMLYHLPQAVLAVIIMMAVIGLLDVSAFVRAWKTHHFDGLIGLITFAATLYVAPHLEYGVFLGVALSLAGYLFRTMRPHVAVLSLHEDASLRDVRRYGLPQCRNIAVVRFDGPINFVNCNYLEDAVLARIAEMPQLRHLLIAAHGVNEIDSSGVETLHSLFERVRGAGQDVSISGLKDAVIDVLRRSRLYDLIGVDHMFRTQVAGLAAIYPKAHQGSEEQDCPLRTVMPEIAWLSLHPDGGLRDASRNGLRECKRLAVVRIGDAITYANAAYLDRVVRTGVKDRPDVKHVLLVANGIASIDNVGAVKLGMLVIRLREDGYGVTLSGIKENVLDVLRQEGVSQVIGAEHMYPTQVAAIAGVYIAAHDGAEEEDCPLSSLRPCMIELSLHPNGTLRSVERHGLRACPHIMILRYDGPVTYANFEHLEEKLLARLRAQASVRDVVFDARSLGSIPMDLAGRLFGCLEGVARCGYPVSIVAFPGGAFDVLGRRANEEPGVFVQVYPEVSTALAMVYHHAHVSSQEESCPLRAMLPGVKELSRHPDGSLRDVRRHGLQPCPNVTVIQLEGALEYAQMRFLGVELFGMLRHRAQIQYVLLDAQRIHYLDPAAARELCRLIEVGRKAEYSIYLSEVSDEALDALREACVYDVIDRALLRTSTTDAVRELHALAHTGTDAEHCPLLEEVRLET